jgi:hypothetical protein
MMTIRHHFKIFSLTLLFFACSTQAAHETVNESIATTSTTLEVVQGQEEIISSTTTTTIPPTQLVEKTYEKALLGELSKGDCFDSNKHDLLVFDQTVIKKPCFEPHTYQVVFKNPDDRQSSSTEGVFLNSSVSDLQLLDLERAKICNEYKSLVEITEYIDEKYFDFKLIIQPALSSENSTLGSSEIVMCIAHLDDLYSSGFGSSTWSITEDIDFWIFDTAWWADDRFAGIACYPDNDDAFYSSFDVYFAEVNPLITAMTFTYVNDLLDLTIEVDLLEKLKYFNADKEYMIYYSLKVSSLYIESIFDGKPLSDDVMEAIFTSNEGVTGYFSYTDKDGEIFEESCRMDE